MKTGKFWIVKYSFSERGSSYKVAFDDLSKAQKFLTDKTSGRFAAYSANIIEHEYPKPPEITGYDPQQTAEIQSKIVEAMADEIKGLLVCSWSEKIVERKKQRFAIFGNTAFELLPFEHISDDDGTEIDYKPVIIDGKMFRMDPEEGRGGMLYLMNCTMRRGKPSSSGWMCGYMQHGWLYTKELEMSMDEVKDRLIDEIKRGENVLTHKPAGWV